MKPNKTNFNSIAGLHFPPKLYSLFRVMHSAAVTVKAAGLNYLLLFLNKNLKFLSNTYPAFFNLPGAEELLDADGCQTHTGSKTSKVEKER